MKTKITNEIKKIISEIRQLPKGKILRVRKTPVKTIEIDFVSLNNRNEKYLVVLGENKKLLILWYIEQKIVSCHWDTPSIKIANLINYYLRPLTEYRSIVSHTFPMHTTKLKYFNYTVGDEKYLDSGFTDSVITKKEKFRWYTEYFWK